MDLHARMPLWCGALAGPIFTLTWLAEGTARAHYDPLRHPVSSLALGDRGWTQTLNFLVAAALTISFAGGVHRASRRPAWGPPALGLWGAGLLGAGVFVTDPIGGYPPGTPDRLAAPTAHGALHDRLSLAAFAVFIVACLLFARSGGRGWRLYSIVSVVVFAVTMAVSGVAFGKAGTPGDLAGLFQRLAISTAWLWQTALALRLLRDEQRDPAAETGTPAAPPAGT